MYWSRGGSAYSFRFRFEILTPMRLILRGSDSNSLRSCVMYSCMACLDAVCFCRVRARVMVLKSSNVSITPMVRYR